MKTAVVTRTFYAGDDGNRRFLELSWSGCEVETVTGRVGSEGPPETLVFPTLEERDAWLVLRIRQARDEGFEEGSGLATPEAPALEAAVDVLRRHRTTALRPRCSRDDQRDASKLGGMPWLPTGQAWPICPSCTLPMRFVLQLHRGDAPAGFQWAFRHELIQYFHCDAITGKQDCVFAAGQVVRHVAGEHPPADPREALPSAVLERRVTLLHAESVRFAEFARQRPPAVLTPDAINQEIQRLYQVPTVVDPRRQQSDLLYPAHRIVGWEEVDDVPARCAYTREESEALWEHHDSGGPPLPGCVRGEKLGGHPDWRQAVAPPGCHACGTSMRHLFQIPSDGIIPYSIYGNGTAWIFVCPACQQATLTAQR